MGYCAQFDSFPRGLTGFQFVLDSLMLFGMSEEDAHRLTPEALERVQLDAEAAHRKIAGYSKGMRQKIRLAQAIAHHPRVLVLDEPLNGLDPMARAESLALFQELGRQGMHVVISSHILDEVDRISDRVVLITGGYLIAQGNIHEVRQEVRDKPMQVLIRCDSPELLASKMFAVNHCVEARLHADGQRRVSAHRRYRPVLPAAERDCGGRTGEDRSGGAGRRQCECHLPVPDRFRRERRMMTEQSYDMRSAFCGSSRGLCGGSRRGA